MLSEVIDPRIKFPLPALYIATVSLLCRILHDTCTNPGATGQHLLHIVAACWSVAVASFLVSHGADIHCTDTSGRTPLHIAASTNHTAMVEYLLGQGADIDSCTLTEKQTAIHHAARSDSLQTLHTLIEHGGRHTPHSMFPAPHQCRP